MRFLMVLVASIALLGCGDGSKLSRDKAKNLIQSHVEFNSVKGTIPLKINYVHIPSRAWDMDKLSKLAQESLITYTEPRSMLDDYQIAITEKGRKFIISEGEGEFGPGVWVKFCDRQIVEILGIEQPEPQSAIVQFTSKTADQTPFGSALSKACTGETHQGKARLSLFDDGWRVKDVMVEN